MPAETVTLGHLLTPISAEAPAGADLRFSPEWKSIENARRSDDEFEQGAWQTAERKTANWSQVLEISSRLLKQKSKDLRLAMFLVEAEVRTEGFRGLAAGLRFTGELLNEYWDKGLLPLPEPLPNGKDSLADRAKALAWLNDKLADVVSAMPITFASPPAPNYSYAGYLSARSVGREKDYEQAPSERREIFDAAKREGRCLDAYDGAVKLSSRAFYEALSDDLQAAIEELASLERVVADKFEDSADAPGFSEARTALTDIKALVDITLLDKGPRTSPSGSVALKPAPSVVAPVVSTDPHPIGTVLAGSSSFASDIGAAWEEAQSMLSSGQVDRALARMGHLAQSETSGRNRFQRKLLLAEACLKNRPRLARTILEELAEQIDKYKLEEWETTDIVGGVWTRLYRIYVESNETEKASQLYGRLCRLDPWQTLSCSED